MRVYVRWLLGLTLYLGCCQFVFLAFIQNPGNPHDFSRARLPDLVQGTGYRPFVYRTLLPTTVRLVEAALPDGSRDVVARLAHSSRPLGELFASTPAADEDHPVTYLIAYTLEFVCLLAFALTLRVAIAHFYDSPPWARDLIPIGGVLLLPLFFRYISYDYDLPQLFLFTLGLLLLARRRWYWFYPVFVLGVFNKETTALLVVIHLLAHRSQLPRRALIRHAVAQALLLGLIRVMLQFVLFADNPGVPVEVWIARNWQMISDPERWAFLFFHFAWAGDTAIVVPTNFNLLFLLALPLIFWKWSAKPVFLRRALWIAPLLLILAFVFGQIDELRDYYEAYIVAYLLAAGTLSRIVRSESPDVP